ncbi:MAG: putative ABC transporter permease [Clostridia bacterium]|nr:putative ABC transporter permease [Clostridia bacterium]
MSFTLIILFLFFMGSLIGWVMELFFRRMINPEKKWVNPGFLIGPYLPLYGFGLTILYLLASFERFIPIKNVYVMRVVLFVIMAAAMTLIEYIAGIIFIKKMKVKLWDYSDQRFNIGGVICLKYSCLWALLGAIYYFFIHKHIIDALIWLSENLAFSFFVGMFYGIFIIDFVYSANLMAKIKTFADENEIIIKLEELKLSVIKNAEEKKIRFIFPIPHNKKLKEELSRYKEMKKKLESELKSKIKKK